MVNHVHKNENDNSDMKMTILIMYAFEQIDIRKPAAEEIRCVFDDNSKIIFVKSS